MRINTLLATSAALALVSGAVYAQGQGQGGGNSIPAQIANHETRIGTLEGQNLNGRLGTLEGQNLNGRVSAIEGQNLGARVLTLEAENHGARLDTLESQNLDTRVTALESNAPAFPVQTTIVSFFNCFDLETGQRVGVPGDPSSCPLEADVYFAFDGRASTPTVLFWNPGDAGVALLPSLSFNGVDASILDLALPFADHIDSWPGMRQPFTGASSALVRTGEGNIYKVGNALCFTPVMDTYSGCAYKANEIGVRFSYQRIQ